MFDIPVIFEPDELHSEEQVYPRFEIDTITETQVRLLSVTKSISVAGNSGMPLYIKSLDSTSFSINDSLDSYIMFIGMFQNQGIYLAKDENTKKQVTRKDLYKFVFD